MKFFRKYKTEILFGGGALIAGILSFVITLNVYPLIRNSKKDEKLAYNIENVENNTIENENKNNDPADILKSELSWLNENIPNLSENTDITSNNPIEIALVEPIDPDVALEDENIYIESEEENNNVEENVAVNTETNNVELDEEKVNTEIEYVEAMSKNIISNIELPADGEIILEFAKDKLVYSETLEEWITHDGIDIASEEASPVKCALDGVVESIKMDPRYGNTIIIKHSDNLKTVYSNLSTLDLVYVGKKVKQGDIISGVGAGFGFESKEGAHVHFEVIENGKAIKVK